MSDRDLVAEDDQISISSASTASASGGRHEGNRESWGGRMEFILSCLGFAVGLGNVWRYPYLAGRYGGAAFMLAYLLLSILIALPVFYMELAIGQFGQVAPAVAWSRLAPLFGGLGVASVMISAYISFYYNMIIGWAIYYLFASMQSPLPWQECGNSWNDDRCIPDDFSILCPDNTVYYKRACYHNSSNLWAERQAFYNESRESPTQQFLERQVLRLSSGIDEIGSPDKYLVLCLFTAWAVVFFCLIEGIKSSGKVVYFTATFPYVILFILLVRGYTLEGSRMGFDFFMIPDPSRWMDVGLWANAAKQVFFSLSLGNGGLTTLASYNRFHNNIFRDSLIIVAGDFMTSFLSGHVIFSILGHLAYNRDVDINVVSSSGVTLAFVTYPEAVLLLEPSNFWAILFFFMLIILGLDSQMVLADVVITAIADYWPYFSQGLRRTAIVGAVCAIQFCLALCLTTPAGPHIITLVDEYAGGWPAVLVGLLEVIVVVYVYGIGRFVRDLHWMMGTPAGMCPKAFNFPTGWYWYSAWLVMAPLFLLVILLASWVMYKRSFESPTWADPLGWFIAFVPVLTAAAISIFYGVRGQSFGKTLKEMLFPNDKWPDSSHIDVELPAFFAKLGMPQQPASEKHDEAISLSDPSKKKEK